MSTGNGDDDFDSFNDGKTDNVVIDPLSDSANDDVAWHGLDLSDRGLYTVSPSISIYGHLTSLFLRNNQLSEIPAAVCSLSALTSLDMSFNRLSSIPAEIERLQRLKRLNLFNNRITELPLEMGRLWRYVTCRNTMAKRRGLCIAVEDAFSGQRYDS